MYQLIYHPGLASRWRTFSEYQRIAMIANELNRAKNMCQQNDDHETKQALERAFELIDLTVEYARKNLRREILRFREILGSIYMIQNCPVDSIIKLNKMLLSLNYQVFNSIEVQ